MKHKIQNKITIFKIANKEALIGIGLAIFNFSWWFAFAYGLGSKNPSDYTYVLGLPAWFFYSCVVGIVVMSVLVFIIVKGLFQDVPFDLEELEEK